jgi:hypothetical protein
VPALADAIADAFSAALVDALAAALVPALADALADAIAADLVDALAAALGAPIGVVLVGALAAKPAAALQAYPSAAASTIHHSRQSAFTATDCTRPAISYDDSAHTDVSPTAHSMFSRVPLPTPKLAGLAVSTHTRASTRISRVKGPAVNDPHAAINCLHNIFNDTALISLSAKSTLTFY